MSDAAESVAPPGKTPEKARRGLPSGITGNALVAGIISAIVAGVISFYVAHWQSQDAARQAMNEQQTAAVVQLETAADTFYQGTIALWLTCLKDPTQACTNETIASPWAADQATFNADRQNVSDPQAAALAARLDNLAGTAITYGATYNYAEPYIQQMDLTYQQLITRCGQLLQGR